MVTEPRRYLVRPNYALLEAGSYMTVHAKLRPLPNLKAVQQLLSTKQKFLFKWRVIEENQSDSMSMISRKSSNRPSMNGNPSVLVRVNTNEYKQTEFDIFSFSTSSSEARALSLRQSFSVVLKCPRQLLPH